MNFGNNGMFGGMDLGNLLNNDVSIFTTADVKTILGKNIVKNYLCKIDFEIRTLGFSESSMDIIDFYEDCKENGGIIEFLTNPVVKMIMEEMESMFYVKSYLKQRIFNDIEVEKAQSLENIYNNNEELLNKLQNDRQKFMVNKENRRKAINKIIQKYSCTYKEAERIYNEQMRKNSSSAKGNVTKSQLGELDSIFEQLEKIGVLNGKGDTKKGEKQRSKEKSSNTDVVIDEIDDDVDVENDSSDDTFWD